MGQRHGLKVIKFEMEPDNLKAKFLQFLSYRFMKNSQNYNSIENRILRIQYKWLFNLFYLSFNAFDIICSMRTYKKLFYTKLGNSLFIQFKVDKYCY